MLGSPSPVPSETLKEANIKALLKEASKQS